MSKTSTQIVGMSATLPNMQQLADWLQARLYITNFRPVPLTEMYKIGNKIYNANDELIREFTAEMETHEKDPNHLIPLITEVLQKNTSVLIFCPTKKWCSSCTKNVAKLLHRS